MNAHRCLTGLLALALGCHARAASNPNPAPTPAPSGPGAREGANRETTPHGPTIDGDTFVLRKLIDTEQGGIPLCIYSAPEKWRDQGRVTWNYAHTSNPVTAALSLTNPANDEAFFVHPNLLLFCLRPDAGFFREGQNQGGLIYTRQPWAPDQTLLAVVRQWRSSLPGLQLVGSRELPELPKALQMAPSRNQKGVGIRITYELDSRPVEEEFYAVYDSVEIPYDGPQGRTWQVNWGLTSIHSFRAPAGTLARRLPVFTAIAKSFRPNPTWQQRVAAVNAYLAEQFNRQLQAGYDAIAAAGALSRQISASNDAMIAAIDRRMAASRSTSPSGGTSGRSATEKFDDYIRGVETLDDPYYGRTQLSNTQSHHWTDGYGSYRSSNDPNYNPSNNETGNWQRMTPSR